MQSTRFDDAALTRIKRAAKHEGVSVSEFIRLAATERAKAAPAVTVLEALGDFVGFISSGPTPLTGDDAFGDALEEQHQREAAESRALRERRRAD